MSHTTQCPSCQTRFRVSDDQLNVAGGLVRCGRCSHVFNALESLVDVPPPAPPQPLPEDDFELELPEFDPQHAGDAPAAGPVVKPTPLPMAQPEPAAADTPAPGHDEPPLGAEDLDAFQRALNEAMQAPSAPLGQPFAAEPAAVADSAPAPRRPQRPEPLPEAPLYKEEFSAGPREPEKPAKEKKPWPKLEIDWRKWMHRIGNGVLGLLGVAGLLLLTAQLTYYNRTRVAAEVPELRPTLEKACARLRCSVPYPTDADLIRTEWSEMAFVPEHSNLIQLSATLKNHAPYPQAFPVMELTLKDSEDQVLVRRSFTPDEYLRADDRKLGHFNPNSEIKVVVRLDVGKLKTMGYSLFWYYP